MSKKSIVMLAQPYRGEDPTGWCMSEKIDGHRALWDGEDLLSRNRRYIYAPKWFLALFPKGIKIDMELSCGRGQFQKTMSIVRKKYPVSEEWKDIWAYVISFPDNNGDGIILAPPFALINQEMCLGKQHLDYFYDEIVNNGGEGVMLRRNLYQYEYKRSNLLLKIKPEVRDAAIVMGYQEGTGKYKGLMGALLCAWKDKSIRIGSGFTDAQRECPPDIESVVNFEYQCLTDDGVPRFPRLVS